MDNGNQPEPQPAQPDVRVVQPMPTPTTVAVSQDESRCDNRGKPLVTMAVFSSTGQHVFFFSGEEALGIAGMLDKVGRACSSGIVLPGQGPTPA